jgi:hypothetical protein
MTKNGANGDTILIINNLLPYSGSILAKVRALIAGQEFGPPTLRQAQERSQTKPMRLSCLISV